jgi:hypothetical protein
VQRKKITQNQTQQEQAMNQAILSMISDPSLDSKVT